MPKAEYGRRWSRAVEALCERNIDLLFVTDPYNFNYFTGASPTFSYTRTNIFLLAKDGRKVVLVHEFAAESTRRETWIDDVRTYKGLQRAPLDDLGNLISELGPTSKIAAELGYEQRLGMSLNDFLNLQRGLENAEFSDSSDLIWKIRLKKSPEEVKRLKMASKITSEAYESTFERAKPMMSEIEVSKSFFHEITDRGGSNPWCFISSGPYNYTVISGGPTKRKLMKGNIVWIDGGCSFGGYWSDFCRNAVVGKPSEKQKLLHTTIVKITNNLVKAFKPGARISEIANDCEQDTISRGMKLTFNAGRLGHGIGLMLTEPPHIANYDRTVLEPGMVVTAEPGFVTEYGCFQNEQDVLITDDGHEVLSKATTDLHVI